MATGWSFWRWSFREVRARTVEETLNHGSVGYVLPLISTVLGCPAVDGVVVVVVVVVAVAVVAVVADAVTDMPSASRTGAGHDSYCY
jgi:hypothetical protein